MDLARYAELFRTESREHLAEIDAALLALETDGDAAHVAVLFRSTHTIKGMAASMGYHCVEQLSHALESLLDGLRSGKRPIDEGVVALLFDGTDALAQAVDDAVDGRHDSMAHSVASLLERLASAAERDAHDVFPRATASVFATTSSSPTRHAPQHVDESALPTAVPATATRLIEVRLAPDAALKGVRAMMVVARLDALGTTRGVEPPPHQWNHDAFDGVLHVTLHTTADDATLEQGARSAGDVQRVAIRTPTVSRPEREALRHVRIDARRLDTLLDLVGELVITRDRLVRTADRPVGAADVATERALATAVLDTSRLVSAVQEEVLRTRMVPIGQVFDRFPRLVRDVARDLGKEIAFVTEGRDIELDRSLLDAIGDPIVHLLRNAIDHGMELPMARREAGKSASGRLVLRAARERAAVIVQVSDDGGGIDRQAVLARARKEGLIDADTATLGDDGLLRVLARAGFSTATSVTAVSGRGVGIDVVASRVRSLGGTIELQSVKGQGTTFTLRLPVTLAIVRALLVRVGGETFALPASHVREALEYDAANLVVLRGCETITLRDDVIPLLRLRRRFGILDDSVARTHVVVVEAGGRRQAIEVDSLVGQQDVVVKPYDAVHGAETLFAGATILGDGTPALIVDLGSLT
jgi:two-component system chemotaxis sensor kinase CheA